MSSAMQDNNDCASITSDNITLNDITCAVIIAKFINSIELNDYSYCPGNSMEIIAIMLDEINWNNELSSHNKKILENYLYLSNNLYLSLISLSLEIKNIIKLLKTICKTKYSTDLYLKLIRHEKFNEIFKHHILHVNYDEYSYSAEFIDKLEKFNKQSRYAIKFD